MTRRLPLPLAIGIAAALLLAAAVVVLVERRPEEPPPPAAPAAPARRSVAILGLRNGSGDPAAAWMSTALAELLALELRAGDHLRTVSAETVARARQELQLAEGEVVEAGRLARARARLGADLLLGGTCTTTGAGEARRVVLEITVQDARSGDAVARARAEGTERALVEIVSAAGGMLREQLGVRRRDGGTRPASGFSQDPLALRLHAEGLDRLRHFDATGALERLQKALQQDPASAQLHATLAAAWAELGFDQRALQAARRAFELAADLPLGDRLPIEARYRERAGDWSAAADIHRTLLSRDPGNAEHALALAASELKAGDVDASLLLLAELRRSPGASDDPRIDLQESRAESVRGNVARSRQLAQAAAEGGRRLGARTLVADALLVVCEAARRATDLAGARAACEEARLLFAQAGDRGGVARALAERASVEWYGGEFDAARTAAEASLATAREISDRGSTGRALNTLAGLQSDLGHLAEARRLYVETLSLATEVADPDREWVATHNIGIVLWKMGDLPTARRALDESLALASRLRSGRREAFSRFSIGVVLLDQGDLDGAAQSFGRAGELAEQHDLGAFAADPLYGLGRVQLERDELDAAARSFEESAALRRARGSTSFLNATTLATAAVELERGRLEEAERAVAEAVAAYRRDRARVHEGLALALGAVVHARQGRAAEAERDRAAAAALVAGSEAVAVRLQAEVLLASLGPGREDTRRQLVAARAEAGRAGLKLLELEARTALARHAAVPPAAELAAVVAEAEARGYRRLARHARSSPPPSR